MSDSRLKRWAVCRWFDGRHAVTMFEDRDLAAQAAVRIAEQMDCDVYLYEAVSCFQVKKQAFEMEVS